MSQNNNDVNYGAYNTESKINAISRSEKVRCLFELEGVGEGETKCNFNITQDKISTAG